MTTATTADRRWADEPDSRTCGTTRDSTSSSPATPATTRGEQRGTPHARAGSVQGTGLWLGSLGDHTITELVRATFPEDCPPLLVQTELRHAGGAIARGTARPAAFGNRTPRSCSSTSV